MHARLARVLADKADLVIWQGGVNDPLTGVKLSDFERLTRDDLLVLRENGAGAGDDGFVVVPFAG